MNHMSKSTGTDVMFIRNQWIEIATICMLEWSCQLHNAFRFDCAICSVIASHVGFTKKKGRKFLNGRCTVSLRHGECALYEWLVQIILPEASTNGKWDTYIFKSIMFINMICLIICSLMCLSIYLFIYLFMCLCMCKNIYWCVCLLSGLFVNLSIWYQNLYGISYRWCISGVCVHCILVYFRLIRARRERFDLRYDSGVWFGVWFGGMIRGYGSSMSNLSPY